MKWTNVNFVARNGFFYNFDNSKKKMLIIVFYAIIDVKRVVKNNLKDENNKYDNSENSYNQNMYRNRSNFSYLSFKLSF